MFALSLKVELGKQVYFASKDIILILHFENIEILMKKVDNLVYHYFYL